MVVEQLFLAVPRGCLQFVFVVFPDHTYLLFFICLLCYCFVFSGFAIISLKEEELLWPFWFAIASLKEEELFVLSFWVFNYFTERGSVVFVFLVSQSFC